MKALSAFLITARSLRSLSSSLCLCGETETQPGAMAPGNRIAEAIPSIKEKRQS